MNRKAFQHYISKNALKILNLRSRLSYYTLFFCIFALLIYRILLISIWSTFRYLPHIIG